MKRRPRIMLKLGVFLLLGAVVNVAMAWGCTLWIPARSFRYEQEHIPVSSQELEWWIAHVPEWFVTAPTQHCAVRHGFGFDQRMLGAARPVKGSYVPGVVHGDRQSYMRFRCDVLQAGMPMRSFVGWHCRSGQSVLSDDSRGDLAARSFLAKSPSLLRRDRASRWMPLQPIWPGFAINTLFYAAILALLFYGPGKVRRWIRVHRSQCPACGHIIAAGTCTNGLCSECGTPLPKGFKAKPQASAHT